jgi:hypothetical protein
MRSHHISRFHIPRAASVMTVIAEQLPRVAGHHQLLVGRNSPACGPARLPISNRSIARMQAPLLIA